MLQTSCGVTLSIPRVPIKKASGPGSSPRKNKIHSITCTQTSYFTMMWAKCEILRPGWKYVLLWKYLSLQQAWMVLRRRQGLGVIVLGRVSCSRKSSAEPQQQRASGHGRGQDCLSSGNLITCLSSGNITSGAYFSLRLANNLHIFSSSWLKLEWKQFQYPFSIKWFSKISSKPQTENEVDHQHLYSNHFPFNTRL